MNQLLPRGCRISDERRIKTMIADGDSWQIYLTNLDSYVLAVKPNLYHRWIIEYSLPSGLFILGEYPSCCVFSSSGDYIISSLEKGPYPVNNSQIEAFSIAFNTALTLNCDADFHDAIYIEEYSLLLPVSLSNSTIDNKKIYGKWVTGGVPISVDYIKRVSEIMSWLSKDALLKYVRLAGFEVNDDIPKQPIESEAVVKDNQEQLTSHETVKAIPNDVFTLIGRPELERFFNDNIIDIVLHQEQYKRMGISFPGATILHGPPGCGKTYAVERLSEYLGWKRFDIDSSTIASTYIHDTSKKISEVFLAAIKAAPSILVIDEMEAFLSDRGMAGPSGTYHIEEVAEFLRRIPEAISKSVLVFAMTNMIESIDPAILRRGRFDHIIEVKMPNAEEIEALLIARFAELPVDSSVNSREIAQKLAEHPMSDVTFILREAGRFAVKRSLNVMDSNCFIDAINLLPKKKERPKIGF